MRLRAFTGFQEEDFAYFTQVKRANQSNGGHPFIRQTEEMGQEVRMCLASLGELLLPNVKRLVPDITVHVGGLGSGRFSKTLFLAFYRRKAGHPSRDLQLAIELGEPGLRVALRFGSKQNDAELQALQERFFLKLNHDASAKSTLEQLVLEQFIIKSEGQKNLSIDEFLQNKRGRIEKIIPREDIISKGASLADEITLSLDRLFSIYRYVLETHDEVELGLIESFLHFSASRGFVFPLDIVVSVFASLATRPILILAGVSGTGKTKLAQLLAEFLSGPFARNPRIAFLPVRPDWLDTKALLGFYDLLHERYEATNFLDLLLHSQNDEAPHFAIFDELNLARPELFLADILSALESRRYDSTGRLVTQAAVPIHHAGQALFVTDAAGREKELPREIPLHANIYIIGTLNLDEASFALSPRLYDRANVIEMPAPQIASIFEAPEESGSALAPGASRTQRERFTRGGFYTGPVPLSTRFTGRSELIAALDAVHTKMAKAGYPIGARSARDALSFAVHAAALGGAPWAWSMDRHIGIRLVPRLLSQLPLSKSALWELLLFCRGDIKALDEEILLEEDSSAWAYPFSGLAIQNALRRLQLETSF
jgi:MoxR-like ATPase